ncbi:MAG: arginyltransferase [Proteobacteria bacterium]|nr:arginyltransferase [Pseudomonadota bacterium]
MTQYDQQCALEFEELQHRFDDYFVAMAVECPYHLPYTAVFYQALFAPVPERIMELFLASGYRRNGNCLYCMRCDDCSACIPIRLHPQELRLNRNQRRVMKKNLDLDIEFGPVQLSPENLALCQKFLSARYPHKNNQSESYYSGFFLTSIVSCMEIRYRLDGRLVGCAIVDVGENWMNAVYFYFDPDEAGRSLGTFNILTMAEICLNHQVYYLYLGYYIQSVAAMNYKSRFSPHYLYLDGGGQQGRMP